MTGAFFLNTTNICLFSYSSFNLCLWHNCSSVGYLINLIAQHLLSSWTASSAVYSPVNYNYCVKNVTSVLSLYMQVAGAGGAFGQKGEKGEPAVIEPVRLKKIGYISLQIIYFTKSTSKLTVFIFKINYIHFYPKFVDAPKLVCICGV